MLTWNHALFLEHLDESLCKDVLGISSHVNVLVDTAMREWPSLSIPPDFEKFVAGHWAPEWAYSEKLGERISTLYLVAGCLSGDSAAVQQLRDSLLEALPDFRRKGYSNEQMDEAVQRTMDVLLVGKTPKLVNYSAKGSLRAWLRTVLLRIATRMHQTKRKIEMPPDALYSKDDPELNCMKNQYGPAFKRAFKLASSKLASRERNLLRQHHLDQLSLDTMAAIYNVHRATVARWLAKARERLFVFSREALANELGADPAELNSVMRLVLSQVDVSLRNMMNSEPHA